MATILLVDDVQLFLELEKSFLEDYGHQVVTARSGTEALERMKEIEPALVLLDLYMPGLDGDEVCRKLRADKQWRKLPVIMVTATGKKEDVVKCLAAGCDDYITKPVSKKELTEKVQRLLGAVRRRTSPRVAVSLAAKISGRGKRATARAMDISRNGVYVRSSLVLPPDSPIGLRVALPGGRELSVLGKVKRTHEGQDGGEGGMGIYFVHPAPEQEQALVDYINHQLMGDGTPSAAAQEEPSAAKLEEVLQQNSELKKELDLLRVRVLELEEENQDFAEQIVSAEDRNNTLSNLYIASSKLHSVLNRTKVAKIIQEVVIHMVGAEKFALLLFDKNTGQLCFEAGEGFDEGEFPEVGTGDGLLGEVIKSCESYFKDGPVAQGSDDPLAPIVAIPLTIHGQAMGVLAIYRLFIQKESFEPVDYQLFSMLAEHAATALFSSTLYEASERKRETYRNFMDLLLK